MAGGSRCHRGGFDPRPLPPESPPGVGAFPDLFTSAGRRWKFPSDLSDTHDARCHLIPAPPVRSPSSTRPFRLLELRGGYDGAIWATSSGNRRRNEPPSLRLALAAGQRRIWPLIGHGCGGLPSGDPVPQRRRRESRLHGSTTSAEGALACNRVRIRWIYWTDRSILLAAGHRPIETHRTRKARSWGAPQKASSSAEVGVPALWSCSSGS